MKFESNLRKLDWLKDLSFLSVSHDMSIADGSWRTLLFLTYTQLEHLYLRKCTFDSTPGKDYGNIVEKCCPCLSCSSKLFHGNKLL